MTSSSQEHPSAEPADGARMQELLFGLVRSLVDHPESLRIETESHESGLTLRLFVAPADLGKVIGKQGRTARAIRTLLSAIAAKSNQRLALDVVEAE